MDNYLVVANEAEYCLQEVELYYYHEKMHQDKSVFKRDRAAREFFFHPYGVDICFATSKDEICYGGVLIRAMKNNAGNYICGPISCHDELLKNIRMENGESVLRLSLKNSEDPQKLELEKTIRIKGKKDKYDECLYRYVSKELSAEIMKRPESDYYRKRVCSINNNMESEKGRTDS